MKKRILVAMTLYEFNALSDQQQQAAVWEQSNFVISWRDGRDYLNLYAIDRFFVEIRYNPSWNEITHCRGFCSMDALEPYLHLVKLPSFLNAGPESP